MHTIVFDLETGGVEDRHPDIQIAAIAVDGKFNEVDSFERKIEFNERDADPEALKINHYDPAVWKREAIPVRSAAGLFASFMRPYLDLEKISRANRPYRVAQLCGHNAATFDAPRIQRMFRDLSMFLPADYRVLDTLQLASWYFHGRPGRPENLKLTTLASYFRISTENAHDALADVRLAAAVTRVLLPQVAPAEIRDVKVPVTLAKCASCGKTVTSDGITIGPFSYCDGSCYYDHKDAVS